MRPTIVALTGLKDDYEHDGRVLVEALQPRSVPAGLAASPIATLALGALYEQLNAPFGKFDMDTLKASTAALESSDEARYESIETAIASLTAARDALASQMKAALDAAAFGGGRIRSGDAVRWGVQGAVLIARAAALAASA